MERNKEALETIERYENHRAGKKGTPLTSAERGFMLRNSISNKSNDEIDAIIRNATGLSGGVLYGIGDRFDSWCAKHGRTRPDTKTIYEMNANPADAALLVKRLIPTDAKLYRSYCSFIAGRGR